jgi:imidazolonepropionase-like amidohydrolase
VCPSRCTGCTVMAGFWNSHVHFFERKWSDAGALPAREAEAQLEDAITRFGFTSVFDLSSQWKNTRALRDRIESGEVAGPAIRSTGEGLVSPGALPPEHVYGMMGTLKTPMPEVDSTEAAVAAARRLLKQGVDGVKLFLKAGPPPGTAFSLDLIRAVVDVAHEAGKPVFVHPTNGADALNAILAGVDVIAHTTPHSGDWDDRLVAEAAAHGTALTPTLSLWKYFARHDRHSIQQRIVGTAVAQLRAWIEAGAEVLFGTDLGAAEYDPSEEYALMASAGMEFAAVLSALTASPVKQFEGSKQGGQITEGAVADLAIVRGDPASNMAALSDVMFALRRGRVIFPRVLQVSAAIPT